MITAIFLLVVLVCLAKALVFLNQYARHQADQHRAAAAPTTVAVMESGNALQWTDLDDRQLERFLAQID